MGMAANENPGTKLLDEPAGPRVIVARIASYMHHQHAHPAAFEKLVLREFEAQVLSVAVSPDSAHRLECLYFADELKPRAQVAGVPDFIHRLEELCEFFAPNSVCIADQSYVHNAIAYI